MNPVKLIQEDALKAYGKPVLIRQHYNQEQKERQGYCKRPLLELLQNIEDALKDHRDTDHTKPQALLFLHESTLWIANKGKVFDQRGFQSLCDSDDSPKHGKGFIGSKGTGFKAVLNWTNMPEIYSGDIHARFNRGEAEKVIRESIGYDVYDALKENGGWQGQAPLLRVPLEAGPDEITRKLLAEGWSTVIKLPLLKEEIANISDELSSFDPVNILFLRHLSRLEIKLPESDTVLVERKPIGDGETLLSKGKDDTARYNLFREALPDIQPKNQKELGGSCEIAVAYRIDSSKPNDTSLFNFFPIRNAPSPFAGLLIHATFLLKADRDGLNEDDSEFHDTLTNFIAKLLTEQVVPSLAKRHGPECLCMLKKSTHTGTGHAETIHRELHQCIQDIAFIPDIGGHPQAPVKLHLWKWKLGNILQKYEQNPEIDLRHLCAPDWQEGNSETLRQYEMDDLVDIDHIRALHSIQPGNAGDALIGLNIIDKAWSRDLMDFVCRLPLWQKKDGGFRALADNHPFFEKSPPHTLRQEMPSWLHFDDLYPDFRKDLEEQKLWDSLKGKLQRDWFKPSSMDSLLEHAILPVLKGKDTKWWRQQGQQVLSLLKAMELKSHNELIQKEPLRCNVAKSIRVPVQGGDWQFAGKVYASKGWYLDEPAWGEALVQLADRYLLTDPCLLGSQNDTGIEDWIATLRYAGVSWAPKAIKGEQPSWDRLEACPFPGKGFTEEWKKYIKAIEPDLRESDEQYESKNSSKRIGHRKAHAWGYEGVGFLGKVCAGHGQVIQLFKRLSHPSLTTEIKREGPSGGSRPAFTPETSFLAWQLQHAPVFEVDQNKALLAGENFIAASAMFMETAGNWKSWLPTIDLKSIEEDAEHDELRAFAHRDLNALYWVDDAPAKLWWKWLSQLEGRFSHLEPSETEKYEKTLGKFIADLGKVLNSKKTNEEIKLPSQCRLPCRTSKGVQFIKSGDFFILDDHRWDSLRDSLLENGCSILLAELSEGKDVAALFGMEGRLLSKALRVQLEAQLEISEIPTRQLQEFLANLEKQARVLALVARDAPSKAVKMREHWPCEIKVMASVMVHASLDGKSLGEIDLPFFWDGNEGIVGGSEFFDNLAKALVAHFDLAKTLEDALINLFGKLQKSLKAANHYLRDKNISREAVNEWLEQGDAAVPSIVPKLPFEEIPGKTHTASSANEPTSAGKISSGKSTSEASGVSSRSKSGKRSGKSGGSRPSPKKGLAAEKWLLDYLHENLTDWTPIDISHEHVREREADILLSKGEEQILIEVKRRELGLINLPKSEVDTAKAQQGNYWIAVLVPNGENEGEDFQQYWLKNPLETLAQYCLKGVWRWKEKYGDETEVIPFEQGWETPEAPARPADSFEFRVELPEEVLVSPFISFEDFCKEIGNK